MKSKAYYDGFMSTCQRYGLEKSAATRLYKEADWSSWLGSKGKAMLHGLGVASRWTGRRLGKAIGWTAKETPEVAKVVTDTAKKIYRPVANFARATVVPATRYVWSGEKRTLKNTARDILREIENQTGPINRSWLNAAKKSVNAVTSVRNLPKWYVKKILMKHPYLGSMPIAGAGYWAARGNNAAQNEELQNSALRTLTPSEQLMYQNSMSDLGGYSGVGLDPGILSGGGSMNLNQLLRHLSEGNY